MLGETIYLGISIGQAGSESPQHLDHILQGGTFIRTRQSHLSGTEVVVVPFSYSCAPTPFLRVEGGAVFLGLGGILVREHRQT